MDRELATFRSMPKKQREIISEAKFEKDGFYHIDPNTAVSILRDFRTFGYLARNFVLTARGERARAFFVEETDRGCKTKADVGGYHA